MLPAYKQKLKQGVPVTHSIQKWLHDVDATLQDCFASTDWNMFRDSSDGIEEYITTVTDLVRQRGRPHSDRTYIPQPETMDYICNELKARAAAFKEWETNPDAYKKSHYALRCTIKQAKCQYRLDID